MSKALFENGILNRTEAWARIDYWLGVPNSENIIRMLIRLLQKDEESVPGMCALLYKIKRAFGGDPKDGWVRSGDFPSKYPREEAQKIVAGAPKSVVYRMVPA